MTTTPKGGQGWRKSSYSSGNGNDSCVEVAFGADAIGVRDSKNAVGPQLAFAEGTWRRFVGRL
jgi:hypothetical protein